MRSASLFVLLLLLAAAIWLIATDSDDVTKAVSTPSSESHTPTLVADAPSLKAEGTGSRAVVAAKPAPAPSPASSAPRASGFFGVFELEADPAADWPLVVMHPDTAAPLPGALVRAIPMSSPNGARLEALSKRGVPLVDGLVSQIHAVRTDVNGRALVRSDPRGTVLLIQARDERGPMEFVGLLEPRIPRPLEVHLARVRTALVAVHDERGRAVPGALVFGASRAWQGNREKVARMVQRRTDQDGRVELFVDSDAGRLGFGEELLGKDFFVGVDVIGGEEGALVTGEPTWDSAGHGTVDLVVPQVGELAVRVVDAAGRSISGCAVELRAAGSPKVMFAHELSAADAATLGGFLLPPVACGQELELKLTVAEGAQPLERIVTGPAKPGERVTATFNLESVAPLLRGRAIDAQGQPHAGALLEFAQEDRGVALAMTDAEGRFELEGAWLCGEPLAIQATLEDGGTPRTVVETAALGSLQTLDPDDPWIDLGDVVLARSPLLVEGRLVDTEGEPIVGSVGVTTYSGDPRSGGKYLESTPSALPTDGQGRFCIRSDWCRAAGASWLFVTGFSEAAIPSELVSIPAGERGLELVVSPGATLRLSLDGCPPNTPGGLTASLTRLFEAHWPSKQSTPLGVLSEMGPMPPGRYRLEVTSGVHDPRTVSWARELDLVQGLNEIEALDDALDLHVFKVEFDPMPADAGDRPDFLVACAPGEGGELRSTGKGSRIGPKTWILFSIGPATEVQFRLRGELRSWPIEGPLTRVRL